MSQATVLDFAPKCPRELRVALAQEARDRLHAHVMQHYGALHELDLYCEMEAKHPETGTKHTEFRKRYRAAVAELKDAKQALTEGL